MEVLNEESATKFYSRSSAKKPVKKIVDKVTKVNGNPSEQEKPKRNPHMQSRNIYIDELKRENKKIERLINKLQQRKDKSQSKCR